MKNVVLLKASVIIVLEWPTADARGQVVGHVLIDDTVVSPKFKSNVKFAPVDPDIPTFEDNADATPVTFDASERDMYMYKYISLLSSEIFWNK